MHFKKILGLSGLRIIYAILGLAYSVLQVRIFGTSREVEVFFVANAVVYLVTSLTQSGHLTEFFLPVYMDIKAKHGKEAAHRAFSVLINRFAVFLSIILIAFFFISPYIVSIMAPGFSEADKMLCVQMFRVFLIFMELQFINSFIDVTLNAEKVFGRIEWAAILNAIVSLILLILFYKFFGVWILVITLFAGKIIEFLITVIYVKKIGIKYSLIWTEKSFDTKSFFRIMFTTSGYVSATQVYNMVFTAMATLLPQGTYAIFKYVQQISLKASGILLAPLSTVFFSHFSDQVITGKKELESKMKGPILYSFLLGLIFTCLVVLLGNEIINLLWKTKNVSNNFLEIGYWMLIINFIGFTFTAVGNIYRKVTLSLGKGKSLYHFWTGIQIITALVSYFIILPIGWVGLPMITLLNSALMAIGALWIAGKSDVIISKTINYRDLITVVFSVLLFVTLSVMLNGYLEFKFPISIIITIKLLFGGLLGFGLLFFRHKQLYKKIFTFFKSFAFRFRAIESK